MTYRLELAATAKADIREQAQWLHENVSPSAATKWLNGLYKAIETLQTRPLRCPVAAESDQFPDDVHELLHGKPGKRKHKHRIIFTVRKDTVYVLYVRHTARDEHETRGAEQRSLVERAAHVVACPGGFGRLGRGDQAAEAVAR